MTMRGAPFGLTLLALGFALVPAFGVAAAPRRPPHRARDAGSSAADGRAAPAASAAAPVGSAPAAAGSTAAASSSAENEEATWPSCAEHVPPGAVRPKMREQFPARATSGYAAPLEITVEHGKGETVLPEGFHVQSGGDAARVLGEAGFVLPHVDGGAGPVLTTTPGAANATTKVVIPLLVLPKQPGRNRMTLPPLPIAVSRASGELVTLCTKPHDVLVEDPTASTPEAKPKPNPAPRPQLEEWTLAKNLTLGALAGAALAAIAAWLIVRYLRRPRPAPPPPPPRPPWEVALEELFSVRHAGLVPQARYAEHYDRISDAVRKYLGGRYGFDGLETTSREMASILRRVRPPVGPLESILSFLEECDLVKFARLTPSEQDCTNVLDQAERIVTATIPAPGRVPVDAAPAEAGGAP
jgi:hypothetical protein